MLSLSRSELEQLKRALRILVTPLDYPTADEWRHAANSELRELLRADSAGFLLPESGGPFVYSEEHDPAALARYPELSPPPLLEGTPIFERMAQIQVGPLERAYGEEFHRYLESDYYIDYAGANGAHDTLAAMLPWDETGLAGIQLWHSHPTRRKFAEREIALLEIAYPALHAGVLTHLRLTRHRAHLLQVMDELDQALAVYDASGRLLHRTPRMVAELSCNVAGEVLAAHVEAARTATHGPRYISGAGFRCRIRAFRYTPPGAETLNVVVLERHMPAARSDEQLRADFCLTGAEIRVAREIASGKSNREVAVSLCISIHTAKRHTERVLQKMGVRTRAAVAAKLT